MTEVRTLARCGKPVENMGGRPCMRVASHLGDCIPAMLDSNELDALGASVIRHPANGQFKIPGGPFGFLPKLPPVYLVIVTALLCIAALQAWIDAYVLVTIFK